MAGSDIAVILNELKHYGVKGMRWGKSKAVIPSSDDSVKAAVLKARAKKGGAKALTNQELQTLVTRLNLEQQYSRLNPKVKSDGQKFLEGALKYAGPIAIDLASDQLGPYAGIAKTVVNEVTKKR